MTGTGRGRILMISSASPTAPQVHDPSKAFVDSIAASLRPELSDTGVSITTLTAADADDFDADNASAAAITST